MSQSKDAAELCSLLVDEIYGELTSQIYSVLLRRGRLSVSLLAKYTHLGQRQVRHGLVVLIQQNLVFHNSDEDTGTVFYEADHIAAYALVRSGKILEAVDSRFGAVARDVVQNLLLSGHTKISDLEEAYSTKQNQETMEGQNQMNLAKDRDIERLHNLKKQQICSTGQLHSILLKLLQTGVVEEVLEHMFRSPSDTYSRVEKETLQLYFGGSTKGIKQKEELKIKVRARLKSLKSDTQKWHSNVKNGLHSSGLSNDNNHMNKRIKLSNSYASNNDFHYEDEGLKLDSNMILRVNYAKCTVFLRNQQLIVSVSNRIGKTTSLIYGEALRILEGKISCCQPDQIIDQMEDDIDVPKFTTSELTAAIGDHINPGFGIANTGSEKDEMWKSKNTLKAHNNQQGKSSINNDYENIKNENISENRTNSIYSFNDHGEREKKTQHIKNHLLQLAADDYKFLRKCGNVGLGEWTVDFKDIIGHLRAAELDSMLLETFGSSGHRLVRILREFGKLDEKQLPNMALMRQKDVRTKLVELQMAGIIDIQEVPKDASRTLYRTIFLWYFDSVRVSEMFIDKVYKTMSRVLQRLNVEREKDKEVLRLTQRSDIRDQNPIDYLDKDQLSQLAVFQAKEELLLAQITRLDELVGIFRDY